MYCRVAVILTLCVGGCAVRKPAPSPVALAVPELDAWVCPPAGWRAEPIEKTRRHKQQVWVSPSGDTAYGVIHFSLPLPLGDDLSLWGFLREMKQQEGEATLLKKTRDEEKQALRFVAEGGRYRIRGIILTRGFGGWVFYAGTLRAGTIRLDELRQAVQAREQTVAGAQRRTPDNPQ